MRSCDVTEICSNHMLQDHDSINRNEETFPNGGKIRRAANFYTSELDGCVKIRDSFGFNEAAITIPTLIEEAAKKYANESALAVKEGNEWKKITFSEYYRTIRSIAKAFLKLGLQRFHSVCILGGNSPEWYCSSLAAIMAGGISSGIYQSNSPDACLHCLKTSKANIVVLENEKHLQKILKIKNQAEYLKIIVQYKGTPNDPAVLSWENLLKIGNEQPDDELNRVIDSLAANECCSVLFTSGTTGLPKAVMLSHDNIVFKLKMSTTGNKYSQLDSRNRRLLSFLPLSHVAAQAFELYKSLEVGACVYFADENAVRDTIVENLKAVRPHEFLAVPRIWEKIRDHIDNYIKNSTTLSQQFFRITDTSFERYEDELFCEKIRKVVGLDKCQAVFSAAAMISTDLKRYFARFGIDLMELYGMTETCGAHIIVQNQFPFIRTYGQPIPGTRTKIRQAEQNKFGEICVYGRHVFMGYLNEPETTKNSFDAEGYYCTGDTGEYNEEFGYKITGRIKEILITTGGENIGPALIEFQIKNELPVISHAVLVGDGKKYLSLLITLKVKRNTATNLPMDELAPETKTWCRSLGCNYNTITEIVEHRPSQIYNAIQEGINRANVKAISSAQRVQKFTILPRDFSFVTGELNSTMKLLRHNIYKIYKHEIDAMYST